MKNPEFSVKSTLTIVCLTALVTAAVTFILFRPSSLHPPDTAPDTGTPPAGQAGQSERTILYWRAPMDPMEIYDEPGQSKMGMDLVPVYEDEVVSGVDIRINPVVEQNMGLRTETVREHPFVHTIETYGRITHDETRTGIVSQKVDGWIETLHADYTGVYVEKGAPLYDLYAPRLVAAQEEYLAAFNIHRKNPSPVNRELMLSTRKRLEYFDIGHTEIEQLEKNGKAAKTLLVRSPFTGVVIRKNVDQGAFVKAGADLMTISDLGRVWVEAHIFEYEQDLVNTGQKAWMTLSYTPGKTYTGNISYIYPYLQPKTRDIIIRLQFDNPDHQLKPDMFANIRIKAGPGNQVTAVPSEAIIHSGKEKIVFVQKGTGTFSPRRITTGVRLDGGYTRVVSGLATGDVVVTSGQFLLDSESKMKEAIQKMIQAKSKTPSPETGDDFFDDMLPGDGFFEDME